MKSGSVIAIKKFDGLPLVVQTESGEYVQLAYVDKRGKLRKPKEIKPVNHLGCLYLRINGVRYTKFRLDSLAKSCNKKINLHKTIIKLNENGK